MASKDHPNWTAMKPKIKAAFELLRKAGIAAKMNFSITITDGIAEIYAPKYRGYAFWHHQDHVRVRADGIVTLAFGAFATKAKAKARSPSVARCALRWRGKACTSTGTIAPARGSTSTSARRRRRRRTRWTRPRTGRGTREMRRPRRHSTWTRSARS